jgi:hypothetical protein
MAEPSEAAKMAVINAWEAHRDVPFPLYDREAEEIARAVLEATALTETAAERDRLMAECHSYGNSAIEADTHRERAEAAEAALRAKKAELALRAETFERQYQQACQDHAAAMSVVHTLRAEVGRLTELLRSEGANRYWEGRWRDAEAGKAELIAVLQDYIRLFDTMANGLEVSPGELFAAREEMRSCVAKAMATAPEGEE